MPLPTRPRREGATEHSKITLHKAASYPPLQETQGRGTQCLGDAGEIKSPGHPPSKSHGRHEDKGNLGTGLLISLSLDTWRTLEIICPTSPEVPR